MNSARTNGRGSWIAVASAEHVARGRAGGFMQVCHGKVAPLRRIRPDDVVTHYYSPSVVFHGKDKYQSFTALGVVRGGEPYAFDMGGGFCPYRRDVDWCDSINTPIAPLLDRLAFAAGGRNWGYQFRFGLFAVSEADTGMIAGAMGIADLPSAPRQLAMTG
jgi:hypothetical protein